MGVNLGIKGPAGVTMEEGSDKFTHDAAPLRSLSAAQRSISTKVTLTEFRNAFAPRSSPLTIARCDAFLGAESWTTLRNRRDLRW